MDFCKEKIRPGENYRTACFEDPRVYGLGLRV
jgi:hypothetical protein